jgi:hypothetical protein
MRMREWRKKAQREDKKGVERESRMLRNEPSFFLIGCFFMIAAAASRIKHTAWSHTQRKNLPLFLMRRVDIFFKQMSVFTCTERERGKAAFTLGWCRLCASPTKPNEKSLMLCNYEFSTCSHREMRMCCAFFFRKMRWKIQFVGAFGSSCCCCWEWLSSLAVLRWESSSKGFPVSLGVHIRQNGAQRVTRKEAA